MSTTSTRFVAQIVIQRVTVTSDDRAPIGFGSDPSGKRTERVTTLLSSGFEDEDLNGVVAKVKFAMQLAYPTVKSTTEESSSASPSS